jgi:hypothetical protein
LRAELYTGFKTGDDVWILTTTNKGEQARWLKEEHHEKRLKVTERKTDGMVEEHTFFLTGASADHLRRRRPASICG